MEKSNFLKNLKTNYLIFNKKKPQGSINFLVYRAPKLLRPSWYDERCKSNHKFLDIKEISTIIFLLIS